MNDSTLARLQRWLSPVAFLFCLSALLMPLANQAQAQQKKKYTIALIPGLTTDAFYITMHKGAKAAADALGAELVFQGAPEFNPVQQVPVLNAIIGRKPDAILIAPTDKGQLVGPLKKAVDSGIPVITVDTFIGDGHYQTGTGDADFPLSYIASDNILGGEIAAKALATTDQREQGFKQEMKKHPDITVMETQFNDDDANKAASQFQAMYARTPDLAGVFGANLFSATGAANGVKQANAKGKVRVVAFDAPTSMIDDIKAGNIDIAIAQHPAEIGFYGVVTAYGHLTGQSVPPLIGTGFTVIDKSNIDDPKVKKFIYSD